MLDKIIPKKIIHIFDLIRLDKPIGFMLLMWPCWFALANITQNNFEIFFWFAYCFAGAFLMRSAGCVINDLVDIKLDRNVERTANRPLTSNKVTILEAIVLLIFLFPSELHFVKHLHPM